MKEKKLLNEEIQAHNFMVCLHMSRVCVFVYVGVSVSFCWYDQRNQNTGLCLV